MIRRQRRVGGRRAIVGLIVVVSRGRQTWVAVRETGEPRDRFALLGHLGRERYFPPDRLHGYPALRRGRSDPARLPPSEIACRRARAPFREMSTPHEHRLGLFALVPVPILVLVDLRVLVQVVGLVLLVLFDDCAGLDPLPDAILLLRPIHRRLDAVRGERVEELILLLQGAVEAVHGGTELVPLVGAACGYKKERR